MKILLIEDRGSVSFYLKALIEQDGDEVIEAYSILDAQSCLEKNKIDCIILDLNLDAFGLTELEERQTENGTITGWIWLNNYVLNKNPEMQERTIIYSDYVNVLRSAVDVNLLSDFVIYQKRESSAEKLIDQINKIRKIK